MSWNKGFVFSPKAQDDLGTVWDYTVQRWGADQAERYIWDIQDAVSGLVAGTKPSQPIDYSLRIQESPCWIAFVAVPG